jgi:hypothetical protein
MFSWLSDMSSFSIVIKYNWIIYNYATCFGLLATIRIDQDIFTYLVEYLLVSTLASVCNFKSMHDLITKLIV